MMERFMEDPNPMGFTSEMGEDVDPDMKGIVDYDDDPGWNIMGIREKNEFKLEEGDDRIIVPDAINSVQAGVRIAEFIQRDTGSVPTLYVRAGDYKWQGTIYLTQLHYVDMPPWSRIANGEINNSSKHLIFESPVPAECAELKPVKLKLSGEAGTLLWGCWIFDEGASGTIRDIQLLKNVGQNMSLATVEVLGPSVSFESCGIRSVGGVCLRAAERGSVRLLECELGGLEESSTTSCWGTITVQDHGECFVSRCSQSYGNNYSMAMLVSEEGVLELTDCLLSKFSIGMSFTGRSRVVIERCNVSEMDIGALLYAIDPDYEENNPKVRISSCSFASALWCSPERPKDLEVHNNVVAMDAAGLANSYENNQERWEQAREELEAMDMKESDFRLKTRKDGTLDGESMLKMVEKIKRVRKILHSPLEEGEAESDDTLEQVAQSMIKDVEGKDLIEDLEALDTSDSSVENSPYLQSARRTKHRELISRIMERSKTYLHLLDKIPPGMENDSLRLNKKELKKLCEDCTRFIEDIDKGD